MQVYMPHMKLLTSIMWHRELYINTNANDNNDAKAQLHRMHLTIWPSQPKNCHIVLLDFIRY